MRAIPLTGFLLRNNQYKSAMNIKTPVLAAALLSSLLISTPSHAFLSKLTKKSSETKTKDDTAENKLPEYTGVKHALGVISFDNEAGFVSEWNLGDNLGLMLESSLYDTGRFVIVERAELGAVMAEQDLQNSGRTAQASQVASTGQIRSAKYLATGAITEASYKTSGDSGGLRIKGFNIGAKSDKAIVVAVVKIIDSTSGEVVASKRIRGEAGKSGLSLGYSERGFGTQLGGFTKTPLGEAAQDVIDQATQFIALEMEDYDLEGNVVMVSKKGQVIINRGSNYGVAPGQIFLVREEGEVLIDPSTGAILDMEEGEVTASISVTKVSEKVAYCDLVDGMSPERGAVVVFQ
jgi:curli biogenesis system outer membrane secretion channel CsgG